jgi:peptide chain release factor subunit 3
VEKAEQEKARPVAENYKLDMSKYKNLVEVDTTKDPASLVFIGHVDAGKSTICGNIMYKMGVVD